MKFGSWNIQRGLLQKFDAIQHSASFYKLDIFSLSEVELTSDSLPPVIPGFDYFLSNESPCRIIAYAKHSFCAKQIEVPVEIPAIVLETANCTFGFIYSQFTDKAYTHLNKNLTDKERCCRLIDFLQ